MIYEPIRDNTRDYISFGAVQSCKKFREKRTSFKINVC